MIEHEVADVGGMETLGAKLAGTIERAGLIFLRGTLGAGKTTLVRGMLRGFGHSGPVKSPTFTLVEPYEIGGRTIHHYDLYRVKHPEEIEFLGIRESIGSDTLCLVEWPERAEERLPAPDLEIQIETVNGARHVRLRALSTVAETWLDKIR